MNCWRCIARALSSCHRPVSLERPACKWAIKNGQNLDGDGMGKQSFVIRFEGIDLSQANSYAVELRDTLLDTVISGSSDVDISIRKDDPSTMDFGGTLLLILGTPAAIAIAKGLGDWLKRRDSASISIETSDGKLVVKNISAKDAAKISAVFGH